MYHTLLARLRRGVKSSFNRSYSAETLKKLIYVREIWISAI